MDKLSYEAEWYGRAFVRVDRFYPSSKLCHDCGAKYKGCVCPNANGPAKTSINEGIEDAGTGLTRRQQEYLWTTTETTTIR